MDKKLATLIQNECVAALEAIATKHGYTVKQHGGTLDDIETIFKFAFQTADKAAVKAKEELEFRAYAELFGLEPDDYGIKFIANGKPYTLVALDFKRRKFPIIAEKQDGTRTCFTQTVALQVAKARAGL